MNKDLINLFDKPKIFGIVAETYSQKYERTHKNNCKDCDKLVNRKSILCRSCSAKRRKDVAINNLKDHIGKKGNENNRYVNGRRSYRTKIELKECFSCSSVRNLEIHHIDENRDNNRKTNLQVLCRSCHFKIHHTNPKRDTLGRFTK
jgi:hypothetical protein